MNRNIRFLAVGVVLGIGSPCPLVLAEIRTWTSSDGKHQVQAELVSYQEGVLTLQSADGKSVTIPFAKLSKDDKAYLRELITSGQLPQISQATSGETESPASTAATTGPNSPEEVARKYLVAMKLGDEAALRECTVPHEELSLLWEKTKPIPEAMREQAVGQLKRMPLKRLKIGDTVSLSYGNTITLDEEHVNNARVQLAMPGNPLPVDVQLVEGQWKVNAEAAIAVRKAAQLRSTPAE